METNRSVLQCPECEKALVNIGSKVERTHPVARFINKHYNRIIGTWTFLSPVLVIAYGYLVAGYVDRFLGFALIATLLAPFAVLYLLVRCFSLWRVTDCPYCGFHEEQKLGRSYSGEL